MTRSRIVLHIRRWSEDENAWVVDILLNGQLVASEVKVKEPLDEKQLKDARWYIEKFTQEAPYSVTRAATARASLANYAVGLFSQLKLGELQLAVDGCNSEVVVEIVEDEDPTNTANTAHRLQWELIEDPKIWGSDEKLKVVVKRVVPSLGPGSAAGINRVRTWPTRDLNTTVINLLLVVVRDLNQNAAVFSDIPPFKSLEILARLRNQLQGRSSPIRLNVEVVRPGTFAAFASHLESTRRQHGEGYFQLVHFDMHGAVRKGQAQLYFNCTDDDATEPIAAHEVAELLQRFKIPYVVLNACESAKASLGNDANVARVLRSHGVKEILAMSFKISNDAVQLYLHEFYTQILCPQVSFATAASTARETLRQSPTRSARLGLTRDLLDWFVPVVYSSENDSTLVPPQRLEEIDTVVNNAQKSDTELPSSISSLIGRDFDILRLEKLLIRERCIFISGPAGVGKTSLLEYAAKQWRDTSFVDCVIHIDFANKSLNTRDVTFESLIKTCSTSLGLQAKPDINVVSSVGEVDDSDGIDASWRKLARVLQTQRIIFLFDGLHDLHTILGTERKGSDVFDGGVNEVFRRLAQHASSPQPTECYVVFSDRRESFSRLGTQIGHIFDYPKNVFKLNGLRLADGIELSHRILQNSGMETDKWDKAGTDQLELVLGALKCIPGSLQSILPLARHLDIQWTSFYDFLLRGTHDLTVSDFSGPPPVLWKELEEKRRSFFNSKTFACLMLLGVYWHDGPDMEEFAALLKQSKVGASVETYDAVYICALDQGLINIVEAPGTWIHPEFTLYARSTTIWSSNRPTPVPSPSFFSGITNAFRRFIQSETDRVAQVIEAILMADGTGIEPTDLAMAYTKLWIAEQEERFQRNMLVGLWKGMDYRNMRQQYAPGLCNILCMIKLCISAGASIPLEMWPMGLFLWGSANIRVIGTTAEATLFADYYEQLINHVLERFGGCEVPPPHQHFVLTQLSYLAAAHKSEVPLLERRSGEFIDLALGVIEATEARFGPITESNTLYSRGYPLRYKAIECLGQGDVQGARKYWKLSADNDDMYLAAVEAEKDTVPEAPPLGTPELNQFFEKLQGMTKDKKIARAFIDSRKEAFSEVMEATIQLIESGDTREVPPSMIEHFHQGSRGLKHNHDTLESHGFMGLESMTRWVPENFDIAEMMRRSARPGYRLDQIEAAADGGDTAEALSQHGMLLRKAMERWDLDEAMEHMEAIQRIYSQDPLLKSQIEIINNQCRTLKCIQQFSTSLQAQESDSVESATRQVQLVNDMIDSVRAQGASAEAVQVVKIGLDLYQEAGVGDPASLAENMRTMVKRAMRVLLKHAREPKFLELFIKFCLEVQLNNQRTHEAWKSGDYDAVIAALDEQEKMAQTELGKAMIDIARLHQDKEKAQWQSRWNESIRKWGSCIDSHDYDEAMSILHALAEDESNTVPDACVPLLKEVLRKTENFLVNNEHELATKDLVNDNDAAAVERYDVLLSKLEGRKFSHLSEEDVAQTIPKMRYHRALALASEAMSQRSWKHAKAHFDTATALRQTVAPDGSDPFRDLRELCNFHISNDALILADYECRFGDALGHLAALDALYERQQGWPADVGQTSCPRLTREMLDTQRMQLTTKDNILHTFGDEVGKALIMASRETMNTRYPEYIRKASGS